ncbi:MAG: hypothetical protein KGJ02_07270 [Verrucomicrobiota bacterium]|nr:hypothetical protein [Verrucomicrobiota bacterium]
MKQIAILLTLPLTCFCTAPTGAEILSLAEKNSINASALQQMNFSTLNEIIQFATDFQRQVEVQYGRRPDMNEAIERAKQFVYDSNDFSREEKEQFISLYDAIKEKLTKTYQKPRHGKKKKKAQFELELPPKMAAGLAAMLAGGLLCILPGCQVIGAGLVFSGIGVALDGLASGERPYKIDPSNGARYDVNTGERLPPR